MTNRGAAILGGSLFGAGIGAVVDFLAGGTGSGTDGYFMVGGLVAGSGLGLLVASRWYPPKDPDPKA